MKQKRPDTFQRYNQVLATLNGGLMDVTSGLRPTSSTTYLKTPIIEEKWHQKRKQEGEERRVAEEETRVDVQGARGA